VNKKTFIILALASYTSLWTNPSYAQQTPIQFKGEVSPECAFLMFNNIPLAANSNSDPSTPAPVLVVNNEPINPVSIGNEKSIYESIVASNQQPTIKFKLNGNRGSLTTICNTSSTLSVSIDQVASNLGNSHPKIRFAAGGTGIYRQADLDTNYRETATFNSQVGTSAMGDTALVEVNLPESNTNSIIVHASLTAQ
jgi:hypothetical protein